MRILIADDTEIARIYLAEAVASQGWDSVAVADGELALATACGQGFDLLLLDQRMPGLQGDAVLTRLRATPTARSRAAPAIALSSEMDSETASALRSRGFALALAKPVSLAELVAAMHAALGLACAGEASGTGSSRVAAAEPPLLDDQRAEAALGRLALAAPLRALFRRELALRQPELVAALAAGDVRRARDLIHQLLASCALCGASRLEAVLLALRAALVAGDHGAIALTQGRLEAVADQLRVVLPD